MENVLFDNITNYGITIKDGDIVLIDKGGNEVKLCDNQAILNNMNKEIN